MDFWQTVFVVFRRWYIALPILLLSIGLTGYAYTSVPQVYASGAVLVLTQSPAGPSKPTDPDQPRWITNPMLNLERGLGMAASIVIQVLRTPETAAELGTGLGDDTKYTINNGSSNPELLITGPFIFITGDSRSAAGALEIVERVAQRVTAELNRQQENLNAPEETYIKVVEVVSPTTPQVMGGGSKSRAAAAALGLGVLVTLTAVFAFESAMHAYRRRRAAGS
jgi:hypothetical protein